MSTSERKPKLLQPVLEYLKALQPGWDGYNGRPPTDEALATANNMDIIPGGDGSLQFELHAGGHDVEVWIGPDGKVGCVYTTLPDGESAQAKAQIETLTAALASETKARQEAEASCAVMVGILEEYGDHDENCPYAPFTTNECNCGLSEALATLPARARGMVDAMEAARLLEDAENRNANCPECEGFGVPENCGECFPYFDAARIKRREALANYRTSGDRAEPRG